MDTCIRVLFFGKLIFSLTLMIDLLQTGKRTICSEKVLLSGYYFQFEIGSEESNYEILSEGRNLLADVIISRCRISPKITFLNVRIETIFG